MENNLSSSPQKLLREKLKDIDLRLVDIAQFLEISRPTTYKFIEMYELGKRDKLDSKILKFFNFIMQTPNVNKNMAISYILENLVKPKQEYIDKRQIISNLLEKDNNMKIEFIETLTRNDILDPILGYLLECQNILGRKDRVSLTDEEKTIIQPLSELYNRLGIKLDIKSLKRSNNEC